MNKRRMKKNLLLVTIFLGLIVIAVAAWTVQGIRYASSGGGRFAPAS